MENREKGNATTKKNRNTFDCGESSSLREGTQRPVKEFDIFRVVVAASAHAEDVVVDVQPLERQLSQSLPRLRCDSSRPAKQSNTSPNRIERTRRRRKYPGSE